MIERHSQFESPDLFADPGAVIEPLFTLPPLRGWRSGHSATLPPDDLCSPLGAGQGRKPDSSNAFPSEPSTIHATAPVGEHSSPAVAQGAAEKLTATDTGSNLPSEQRGNDLSESPSSVAALLPGAGEGGSIASVLQMRIAQAAKWGHTPESDSAEPFTKFTHLLFDRGREIAAATAAIHDDERFGRSLQQIRQRLVKHGALILATIDRVDMEIAAQADQEPPL